MSERQIPEVPGPVYRIGVFNFFLQQPEFYKTCRGECQKQLGVMHSDLFELLSHIYHF